LAGNQGNMDKPPKKKRRCSYNKQWEAKKPKHGLGYNGTDCLVKLKGAFIS
jgi:hypothetical protein